MAEYINKAELNKALARIPKTRLSIWEIGEVIDNMPTIDIVTCKECKCHCESDGYCVNLDVDTNDSWFCADGR